MSSPFTMPNYGAPDRRVASSPILAPKPAAVSHTPEEVSVQQMRREFSVEYPSTT